jgi:uncharacterized protein
MTGAAGRKRDLSAAPRMGTIVPEMSTDVSSSIGATLFNKTQRALLTLFFARPEQSFYLRQIVRLADIGQGAAQRELARWVAAGLVVRTQLGHQVHYQANRESPVFEELKALTMKTMGIADVLREALATLADRVTLAFIHGSVARGTEKAGSDVDVAVVGTATFGEVVAAVGAAQTALAREVNPTVYSEREFHAKLSAGHHFLKTVTAQPKVFLIGGERELKRLGA